MTDEERAIAMLGIGLNTRLRGLADGNPEASSKLNLKLIDPNVVQQNFREAVAERRDVPISPPVQDRQGVAEGDLSRPISDDMLIKPISLPTMSSISTMESSFMAEDVKSIGKSLERIAIALEFLVKHFTSSFDKE